jgi:hypothetical protein
MEAKNTEVGQGLTSIKWLNILKKWRGKWWAKWDLFQKYIMWPTIRD